MFKKIVGSVIIAMLGGVFALGLNRANELQARKKMGVQPKEDIKHEVNMRNIPAALPDFVNAAELSVPAVVHVKTKYLNSGYTSSFGFDPFSDFFGNPYRKKAEPASGFGSGVIISADGYIVTNNHVITKADAIEVTLDNKSTYEAKVIGTDPSTDLALLKIEESGLPYLRFGNSDSVKVGEWVLAVGNPFNLTSTVTAGIVSAKARNINFMEEGPSIESFIQTDAAINPGNSGGALVNTKGELIGINAAIASNTGSYAGYGFAIPVSMVRKVVDDLLEFGEVQRAFLGVEIKDLDSKLAKEKGIKEIKGVYISGVNQGGSGEEAGLKAGDVITHIGGIAVDNVGELQEQVNLFRPGDKINVTFQREEKTSTVKLTLKNVKGTTGLVKKEDTELISSLGATFTPITKEEMKKLSIANGMKISKLDQGLLRAAGVREGFIVTHIDKKPITTQEDISRALDNKKGGILIEGIYQNGMRAYYGFGL
ncbi:MAG: Do family serine endopeptidase [Bacteroidota bacterium]